MNLPQISFNGLKLGSEPAKLAVSFSTPRFGFSGICLLQSKSTNSCFSKKKITKLKLKATNEKFGLSDLKTYKLEIKNVLKVNLLFLCLKYIGPV